MADLQPTALAGAARLRDPAHRDPDGPAWRRGRFAERVRERLAEFVRLDA